MRVTTSGRVTGTEPPKRFGVYIVPQIAPDFGNEIMGLNISPAGFQFCFDLVPISIFVTFLEWEYLSCGIVLKAFTFLFIHTWSYS